MNEKAVGFFKLFIRKVLKGKWRVVHFGKWDAGVKGKYGVQLYFEEVE